MAMITAYMTGGDWQGREVPIHECDDSWRDKLAAKAFILPRAKFDAKKHGAEFVFLRDKAGARITANLSLTD